MKNKIGISLIILVITIIVIIILAGAVILSIANNNPIDQAQKAVIKSNVDQYKSELTLAISKEYLKKYTFNPTTFNARVWDGSANTDETVKQYITSMTVADGLKYEIQKGELVYVGTVQSEKDYLLSIGVANSAPTPPRYGVNKPKLSAGMKAVKWNSTASTWDEVTNPDTDTSWYDYTNKQWANAMTADGSMWVWIPRYEYKIATPHSSTAQEISVNFLYSTQNEATSGYIIQPAFTFGTTQLTGIWVAKFEATAREGVSSSTSDNTVTKNVKVVPGAQSWRYMFEGRMSNVCRKMEKDNTFGWGTSGTGIDTHLMKNVEWGAVAYLSNSKYGKNSEVTINDNSSCYTGGGTGTSYISNVAQSTTGTIYGVYDMSGGALEYVAASTINSDVSIVSLFIQDGSNGDLYNDKYSNEVAETAQQVYLKNASKVGDAIYETSTSGVGSSQSSWYGDDSSMIYNDFPILMRGGYYNDGTKAGLFAFSFNLGQDIAVISFRPVLLIDTTL